MLHCQQWQRAFSEPVPERAGIFMTIEDMQTDAAPPLLFLQ